MAQGRVRVNGEVVTTLGVRVDPDADVVEVDGRTVTTEPPRWIALHKPAGTLTTRKDPRGRRTVYALLPEEHRRLRYVGRLDRDTEGLLLFTNEGGLMHRLLHPSHGVEREYRAGVRGRVGRDVLVRLLKGVPLDDGPARARGARVEGHEDAGDVVALVLVEGRKREVRRMLEAVGHPVRWLQRVRFGPVTLGDLPREAWRELREGEVAGLREAASEG